MTEENGIRGRIILGSGRSGTTWVQDCLAEANRLRPIFEPLHEGESALGERYAYRMLAADDENEELGRYFLDLSEGRIRSLWIDYRGRRKLLLPYRRRFSSVRALRGYRLYLARHLSDRRKLRSGTRLKETLIKCIRANLMASWLSRGLGFKTVLLARHPCASIESQHRHASTWNPDPVTERYRQDTCLHERSNGIYLPLLHSRLTKLQSLTLNWVIENQGPVARACMDGYTVIYYEDLREQPSVAWPRICSALGLRGSPSNEVTKVPSQQSYGKGSKQEKLDSEPRWQRTLSAKQLKEIQFILDKTQCSLYDTSNRWPLSGARSPDCE